jgi:segregation and condensation protein B
MRQQTPPAPADEQLDSALESILLAAGGPVEVTALAAATGQPCAQILVSLKRLSGSLRGGIRLQMDRRAAQLVTAPENIDYVHAFLGTARPPALSRAALEILAVTAYRQPVTRPEIEAARGVNSDRAVQTLLARGLIEECGQRAVVGRPMEYATSFAFLEYFGLSSLDDLPPLPEASMETIEPERIGLRPTSGQAQESRTEYSG